MHALLLIAPAANPRLILSTAPGPLHDDDAPWQPMPQAVGAAADAGSDHSNLFLVLGPWFHHQERLDGSRIGAIQFGSDTTPRNIFACICCGRFWIIFSRTTRRRSRLRRPMQLPSTPVVKTAR